MYHAYISWLIAAFYTHTMYQPPVPHSFIERDGHRLAFNIAFQKSNIEEEWSEERYGKLLEVGGGKERMTGKVTREL